VGRFFSIVAEFLINLDNEEKEEEEKRKREKEKGKVSFFELRISIITHLRVSLSAQFKNLLLVLQSIASEEQHVIE